MVYQNVQIWLRLWMLAYHQHSSQPKGASHIMTGSYSSTFKVLLENKGTNEICLYSWFMVKLPPLYSHVLHHCSTKKTFYTTNHLSMKPSMRLYFLCILVSSKDAWYMVVVCSIMIKHFISMISQNIFKECIKRSKLQGLKIWMSACYEKTDKDKLWNPTKLTSWSKENTWWRIQC